MSSDRDQITEVSESDASTTYPIERRVWEGRTAFQDVAIVDSATYGRMLFLDGELQSASADEKIYHSSLVHPVMGRLENPLEARVLVVGGGEGATVREVLRWKPAWVDWVDIDGELVTICERYLCWAADVRDHPRVRYAATDIRDWFAAVSGLASSEASHSGNTAVGGRGPGSGPPSAISDILDVGNAIYDVIILDLPDPDGDTGYLYSPDFWRDVQKFLKVDGLFVTHVGPVRPFGGLGEGARRVLETTKEAGLKLTRDGFYHIGIPSFQGEWGFWMGCADGETPDTRVTVLADEVVADAAQLAAWQRPSGIWQREMGRLF
jgi:spermidine synthase